MNRIVWSKIQRGEHGRVGDWLLFRVSWDAVKPHAGKRWRLTTELPPTMDEDHFEEVEDAKSYAEAVVAGFVARLGCRFGPWA